MMSFFLTRTAPRRLDDWESILCWIDITIINCNIASHVTCPNSDSSYLHFLQPYLKQTELYIFSGKIKIWIICWRQSFLKNLWTQLLTQTRWSNDYDGLKNISTCCRWSPFAIQPKPTTPRPDFILV